MALTTFVAIPVLAGAAVGLVNGAGSWYDGLDKPPLNPPSAVFAPVWTVLYVMIGIAGYLVWSEPHSVARRRALALWTVQLVLNLAWSPIFFGAQRPGWALVEVACLLLAILVTIAAFHRVSPTAAVVMVPYLAWVLFATYLNAGIVVLN